MSYTPKIKTTCGTVTYATCVYYETAVPNFSILISEDCYTAEEVLADLYNLVGDIKTEIDLSGLAGNGFTYPLDINNKIITKNVLETHAESILELKTLTENIDKGFNGDTNISTWGLDTKCLVDSCGDPIVNLKQLLQSIIDKACTV